MKIRSYIWRIRSSYDFEKKLFSVTVIAKIIILPLSRNEWFSCVLVFFIIPVLLEIDLYNKGLLWIFLGSVDLLAQK